MSTKACIGLLGMLLVASAAGAQKVELTPFIGYQFGDWFTEWDDWDGHDTDVEDSETYGLLVDFAINRHAQIELLYSRQDTAFDTSRFHGPATSLDLDVEYFQVGFLWQWIPKEEVRPFVVGSLGVASLDPERGRGDTGFATSVGGGVKLLFNEHVGARFEGRVYTAFIDDDEVFGHSDSWDFWDTDTLVQLDFKAGLIFAF